MTESQPNSKPVDKSEKKRKGWWRWPATFMVGVAGGAVASDKIAEGDVSTAALAFIRNRPAQVAEQYPSPHSDVSVVPTVSSSENSTGFDSSIEYDDDISPREAEILGNKAFQYLLTSEQEKQILDIENSWRDGFNSRIVSLSPLDNRWELRKMSSTEDDQMGDTYWLSPVWFSDESNSLSFSSEVVPAPLGTESNQTHDELILITNNRKLVIESSLLSAKFGFFQEVKVIDGVEHKSSPFLVVLDTETNNTYQIDTDFLLSELTRKNDDGSTERFPAQRVHFFSVSPAKNGENILSYSRYSDSYFYDNGHKVGSTSSEYPKWNLQSDRMQSGDSRSPQAVSRANERQLRDAALTSGRARASGRT